MATPVKYMITSFEVNINIVDTKRIKNYPQETKKMDKESGKLDISVPNAKYIIDSFISLYNKYGWGRLEFTVRTGAGENKICWYVYQINIADIHLQHHGYFVLQGIGIVNMPLLNPLFVTSRQNLSIPQQEMKVFYERVFSYIISKTIKGLITNTYSKKLRIH